MRVGFQPIFLCFLVLPFIHGALLRGEVDADLEDAAAVVLVGQGVVFGVDLLQGFRRTLVNLQLHDEDRGLGRDQQVDASACCPCLGTDGEVEHVEDGVEDSLEERLAVVMDVVRKSGEINL